jgi:hypothetical protein
MAGEFALSQAFVQLRPTAEGFRRDAETQVKAATAGVEGKVKINLDTRSFLSSSRTFQSQLESTNRIAARAFSTHQKAAKLAADAERLLADTVENTGTQTDRTSGFFSRLTQSVLGWTRTSPKQAFTDLAQAAGNAQGPISTVTASLGSLFASGPTGIAILGGIAAGVAAIALAAAPLIAALIPITAGFGLLAAVAIPAFTSITKAVGQGKKAIDALPPAQREVARQFAGLETAWDRANKAVQPELMKAFANGLSAVKELLPALQPLLDAAARAAAYFLKQLSDWLKSPSGQAFVSWLKTDGPKDIMNFAKVMWVTAHAVGDALNFMYSWGKFVDDFFKNLFTIWIPRALDIGKEAFRVTFDEMQIDALKALLVITTGFGHLPGAMGEPFRIASGVIRGEMAKIQGDVGQALGNIQGDINALHGKQVTIGFGLSGSVAGEGNLGHFAGGTSGAAPGWAWVGERGPELVRMRGGEQVIPNHKLGGYALGTGFDFRDTFTPSAGSFDAALNRAFYSLENKVAAAMIRKFGIFAGKQGGSLLHPTGSGGTVETLMRNMAASVGWTGAEWNALFNVEEREAGFNMFARNPSSGAYGLAQFINGPGEYAQYGGNANTAAGQIVGMFNYIRQRYGDPIRAWQHELSFGWYDRGGWLPPGLSLAMNQTGRPERVVAPGGGGDVHVHVYAAPGAFSSNRQDVGRELGQFILEYTKRGGRLFPTGMRPQ